MSRGPLIHQITPTETVGRDTIARYQIQFCAAAFECLEILTGKTIDRVYCDYHDDFVSREIQSGVTTYRFYQVKTKAQRNFQWGKLQLFGLTKKQKPVAEKIAASFAGKLMLHTIRFENACAKVVFLTNVHFDDELEAAAAALEAGDFTNGILKAVVETFNDTHLCNLRLDPNRK